MTDSNAYRLGDPIPPRPLAARWVICGTLTLKTAMHLGGEATEATDMPILRDPKEGRPLLPGTTFAGALRNALADRLAGFGKDEPQSVALLFGGARGDDEGVQSPLIVFDAVGSLPNQGSVEVRDGVAIDPATGTAEDRKKFDYEVLPPGTTFPVRVDLLIPGGGTSAADKEHDLLCALATALDPFSHGETSFGARRTRGLGRVEATWRARRFDLATAEGWTTWARSDARDPIGHDHGGCRDIVQALTKAKPDTLPAPRLLPDARCRVVMDLDLEVVHDILIRSPGAGPHDPDVTHLHTAGQPVLSGTSLAGVMRSQALRIARTIRATQDDADEWVKRLFGPRFEGTRPPPGFELCASRLRVGEAVIEGGQPATQTRIAVDRFTGGVVNGALFDEGTQVGGRLQVRLELRDPRRGELGLVLLVIKDLLDGTLPVGGTSSVGRGQLSGSAWITFHDGVPSPVCITLCPRKTPESNTADRIDEAIQAFHDEPSILSSTVAGAAHGREDGTT